MKYCFSTLFLLFIFQSGFTQEAGWQDLFNGKDLSNWTKLNGSAEYRVEGNEIIGTSQLKTPNSFLATKKMYDDFILEFEVKVHPLLNSGVQIRSNSRKDYLDGRVHGYQVEIDPGPRAYSGGIYDEARRGWLCPLTENEAGRAAFKNGAWNHYRVEAIGSSIRVWVNGTPTANLLDDRTSTGFIALQVHSIDKKEQAGTDVRWRNLRIKTSGLDKERRTMNIGAPEINLLANHLSENEIRKGWRLLWDGKSSEGWRSARSETFPTEGWAIKDGILTIHESGGGESASAGDIITVDKFSDFELKLDFMITEGANSGIKYFVDPEINKGPGSSIGLEYQILDDRLHPDGKKGVNGNRTLASLYDLIPATNLSEPNRNKGFRGTGRWNQARIVVKGNHVEHWLNCWKVVEYERKTQIYRVLVAYSKYKVWPDFGELPEGHILLQDHGNTVHFRSIKIREF